MDVKRSGFIIYTIAYEKCVAFYKDILNLKVLYKKETLTCFDFYGSYLMVEVDDENLDVKESNPIRDRACIRLNVTDVKKACKGLDKYDIPYKYYERDWGTLAKFRDPDGNLIGFRSAQEHELDIVNQT